MTKTEFCRSFPWSDTVIQWFDDTGYHKLDEDRRVSIKLTTGGYADHYDRFAVNIISKTNGRIDGKIFKFEDYLDPTKRADHRPDYKTDNHFKVIAFCGWEWYIAVPADTTPVVKAIQDYINVFR